MCEKSCSTSTCACVRDFSHLPLYLILTPGCCVALEQERRKKEAKNNTTIIRTHGISIRKWYIILIASHLVCIGEKKQAIYVSYMLAELKLHNSKWKENFSTFFVCSCTRPNLALFCMHGSPRAEKFSSHLRNTDSKRKAWASLVE